MAEDVMELVAFLKERLDEDVALARAASASDGKGLTAGPWYDPSALTMATFRAFWTPKRILEDLETKQNVVNWCTKVIGERDMSEYGKFGCLRYDLTPIAVTLAMQTLLFLAQPYADHPDFSPAWAQSHGSRQ